MQCCIITAYHKFNQLNMLVELLSSKFEVYVHIDRKADDSWKEVLKDNEHVHIYSKFNVNWGGKCTLKGNSVAYE